MGTQARRCSAPLARLPVAFCPSRQHALPLIWLTLKAMRRRRRRRRARARRRRGPRRAEGAAGNLPLRLLHSVVSPTPTSPAIPCFAQQPRLPVLLRDDTHPRASYSLPAGTTTSTPRAQTSSRERCGLGLYGAHVPPLAANLPHLSAPCLRCSRRCSGCPLLGSCTARLGGTTCRLPCGSFGRGPGARRERGRRRRRRRAEGEGGALGRRPEQALRGRGMPPPSLWALYFSMFFPYAALRSALRRCRAPGVAACGRAQPARRAAYSGEACSRPARCAGALRCGRGRRGGGAAFCKAARWRSRPRPEWPLKGARAKPLLSSRDAAGDAPKVFPSFVLETAPLAAAGRHRGMRPSSRQRGAKQLIASSPRAGWRIRSWREYSLPSLEMRKEIQIEEPNQSRAARDDDTPTDNAHQRAPRQPLPLPARPGGAPAGRTGRGQQASANE